MRSAAAARERISHIGEHDGLDASVRLMHEFSAIARFEAKAARARRRASMLTKGPSAEAAASAAARFRQGQSIERKRDALWEAAAVREREAEARRADRDAARRHRRLLGAARDAARATAAAAQTAAGVAAASASATVRAAALSAADAVALAAELAAEQSAVDAAACVKVAAHNAIQRAEQTAAAARRAAEDKRRAAEVEAAIARVEVAKRAREESERAEADNAAARAETGRVAAEAHAVALQREERFAALIAAEIDVDERVASAAAERAATVARYHERKRAAELAARNPLVVLTAAAVHLQRLYRGRVDRTHLLRGTGPFFVAPQFEAHHRVGPSAARDAASVSAREVWREERVYKVDETAQLAAASGILDIMAAASAPTTRRALERTPPRIAARGAARGAARDAQLESDGRAGACGAEGSAPLVLKTFLSSKSSVLRRAVRREYEIHSGDGTFTCRGSDGEWRVRATRDVVACVRRPDALGCALRVERRDGTVEAFECGDVEECDRVMKAFRRAGWIVAWGDDNGARAPRAQITGRAEGAEAGALALGGATGSAGPVLIDVYMSSTSRVLRRNVRRRFQLTVDGAFSCRGPDGEWRVSGTRDTVACVRRPDIFGAALHFERSDGKVDELTCGSVAECDRVVAAFLRSGWRVMVVRPRGVPPALPPVGAASPAPKKSAQKKEKRRTRAAPRSSGRRSRGRSRSVASSAASSVASSRSPSSSRSPAPTTTRNAFGNGGYMGSVFASMGLTQTGRRKRRPKRKKVKRVQLAPHGAFGFVSALRHNWHAMEHLEKEKAWRERLEAIYTVRRVTGVVIPREDRLEELAAPTDVEERAQRFEYRVEPPRSERRAIDLERIATLARPVVHGALALTGFTSRSIPRPLSAEDGPTRVLLSARRLREAVERLNMPPRWWADAAKAEERARRRRAAGRSGGIGGESGRCCATLARRGSIHCANDAHHTTPTMAHILRVRNTEICILSPLRRERLEAARHPPPSGSFGVGGPRFPREHIDVATSRGSLVANAWVESAPAAANRARAAPSARVLSPRENILSGELLPAPPARSSSSASVGARSESPRSPSARKHLRDVRAKVMARFAQHRTNVALKCMAELRTIRGWRRIAFALDSGVVSLTRNLLRKAPGSDHTIERNEVVRCAIVVGLHASSAGRVVEIVQRRGDGECDTYRVRFQTPAAGSDAHSRLKAAWVLNAKGAPKPVRAKGTRKSKSGIPSMARIASAAKVAAKAAVEADARTNGGERVVLYSQSVASSSAPSPSTRATPRPRRRLLPTGGTGGSAAAAPAMAPAPTPTPTPKRSSIAQRLGQAISLRKRKAAERAEEVSVTSRGRNTTPSSTPQIAVAIPPSPAPLAAASPALRSPLSPPRTSYVEADDDVHEKHGVRINVRVSADGPWADRQIWLMPREKGDPSSTAWFAWSDPIPPNAHLAEIVPCGCVALHPGKEAAANGGVAHFAFTDAASNGGRLFVFTVTTNDVQLFVQAHGAHEAMEWSDVFQNAKQEGEAAVRAATPLGSREYNHNGRRK